jgi:ribosomal protein L34E
MRDDLSPSLSLLQLRVRKWQRKKKRTPPARTQFQFTSPNSRGVMSFMAQPPVHYVRQVRQCATLSQTHRRVLRIAQGSSDVSLKANIV